MSGPTVREKSQRDPRRKVGTPATRRHMTQYRVGRRTIGIGNQLGPSGNGRRAINGCKPDELPTFGSNERWSIQEGLPDAPLARTYEPAHAKVVCARASVRFGAYHHVTFLDS